MSKLQVNKELTANGFKLVREYDKLPWQHMMFFGIDEDWNRVDQSESNSSASSQPNAQIKE